MVHAYLCALALCAVQGDRVWAGKGWRLCGIGVELQATPKATTTDSSPVSCGPASLAHFVHYACVILAMSSNHLGE